MSLTKSAWRESFEMVLKIAAELGDDLEPVSIQLLAERLGVTTVSTSEMVKRLAAQGFLEHEKYKGVVLTGEGWTIAYSIIRRQRLWECFLVEHLQLNWAGVYEISCRLEHATSAVLAEALANYLEHPTVCPHGNPIPEGDGTKEMPDRVTLNTLALGESARIVSIEPTTTDVYAYLQARRLRPGQVVRLVDIAPLQGPMTLEVGGSQIVLGRNLAELLLVQPRRAYKKD